MLMFNKASCWRPSSGVPTRCDIPLIKCQKMPDILCDKIPNLLQRRAGYDRQKSQLAELQRTIQEWWASVHELDDPPFSTRVVSLAAKVCAAVAICYVLETQSGKLSEVLPSIPPPKDN